MKKKIIIVEVLISLIIICMAMPVKATLSCNVVLNTSKTEYAKKEQFVVDVNVSNIQTENGIMGFLGTLNYDTTSLNVVEMKAQGDWHVSYNSDNGKLLMDKDSPDTSTNNMNLLKITFEVLEDSKTDLTISVENIQVGNGVDKYVAISKVSKKITVKDSVVPVTTPSNKPTVNPTTKPSSVPTVNPSNIPSESPSNTPLQSPSAIPSSSSSSKPTNKVTSTPSSTDKKLPATGKTSESIFILIAIVIFSGFGVFGFVKMRKIGKNRKMP